MLCSPIGNVYKKILAAHRPLSKNQIVSLLCTIWHVASLSLLHKGDYGLSERLNTVCIIVNATRVADTFWDYMA
jgi:hypothetical protein